MIMQTAFFYLAKVLPIDEAIGYLKDSIKKMFGRKGENIVKMNIAAMDQTIENLVEIKYPESWKNAAGTRPGSGREPEFVENVMRPAQSQQGELAAGQRVLRRTAFFRPIRPNTKNGGWPSMFRSGSWKTASSATSARLSARMRPSSRFWQAAMNSKTLRKPLKYKTPSARN